MGYSRRNRRFDPLDLEIINRAYEAAWARVETDLFRDTARDEERKTALRHWAFVLAGTQPVNFDALAAQLKSMIPKPWITPTEKLRGLPRKSAHNTPKALSRSRPSILSPRCRRSRIPALPR
jgi:hypothetical protein